jgi:hypothetical protein
VADEHDFDDLKLTGDESGETADEFAADLDFSSLDEVAAEPVAEAADVEPVEPMAETAENATVEAVDLEAREGGPVEQAREPDLDEEDEDKEPSKLPLVLEVLAVIGVPVGLILLALNGTLAYWTSGYAVAMAFIPYVLWKGRATSTVFTVFLGCVLAAELTAIYVLFVELSRYEFDMKARTGKQQRVAVVQPIERGLLAYRDGVTKLPA